MLLPCSRHVGFEVTVAALAKAREFSDFRNGIWTSNGKHLHEKDINIGYKYVQVMYHTIHIAEVHNC